MHVLRDPVVHFLVLGAGLFAAWAALAGHSGPESGRIVVTRGEIAYLTAGFSRMQRRPPSADEMEGLIRDYVREEAACREALALGLDRGDPIIRQRLRQKMEFIFEDVGAMTVPTDEQLQAYLNQHPDAFRVEPQISFTQIYLDPERRSERLAGDSARLLERLNRAGGDGDVSTLGDPFLLDRGFDAMPLSEVARLFGDGFAAKVSGLAPGRWQGPIPSAYGVHLVRVDQRRDGRLSALADVRDEVQREWSNARRRAVNDHLYAGLLERYTVTVEPTAQTGGDEKLAEAALR